MFVGQYDYKLDGKGRIVIPSKFRDAFEFEDEKGLYVTKTSTDEVGNKELEDKTTFLQLYPQSSWEARTEQIMEQAKQRKKSEWYLRKMAWDADFCELDNQWRINLPDRLITSARLERDVKVVGVVNWIELWDRPLWQEVNQDLDRQASDLEEDIYEGGE